MKPIFSPTYKMLSVKQAFIMIGLAVAILNASAPHAENTIHSDYPVTTGFNAVIMGHSFLKPGAFQLETLAAEFYYPHHEQFRPNGTGGGQWCSRKYLEQ